MRPNSSRSSSSCWLGKIGKKFCRWWRGENIKNETATAIGVGVPTQRSGSERDQRADVGNAMERDTSVDERQPLAFHLGEAQTNPEDVVGPASSSSLRTAQSNLIKTSPVTFWYHCPYVTCQKKFVTEARLKMHKKVHLIPSGKYICSTCGKNDFKAPHYLRLHYSAIHSLKHTVNCPYCGRSFKKAMHLQRHQRTSTKCPGRNAFLHRKNT